jgi:hypothetical protein
MRQRIEAIRAIRAAALKNPIGSALASMKRAPNRIKMKDEIDSL